MTYKEFIGDYGKETTYINFIDRRCSWELYQLDIFNCNYVDMLSPYTYDQVTNWNDEVTDDWL